jgi:alcohol dehydrogenase class IV
MASGVRPFAFATATEILFGRGIAGKELAGRVGSIGKRVFLVTGANPARHDAAITPIAPLVVERYPVPGEPTVELARAGVERARAAGCDVVVAVGGGSVIDAGKAVAALLTNGGDPLDYLEVIGAGREIARPSAPFVAVPTTAGTGAEVTRNAVLASTEHAVKVSLRSLHMLPRLAIIDPELARSVPPAVTAATGLDALTQCMEPFVSNAANPITDAVCRDGMRRAARSLDRVYTDGADLDAREDMALVSLYGGLALANAKLGAVHGFAGPLGGMSGGAHGALCAALLPHVMTANLAALRARAPGSEVVDRYSEVARILTGRADATAEDGIAWTRDLCQRLAIPRLGAQGISEAVLDQVIDGAARSSSMKGNPIQLTREELANIARAAL